MASLVGAPQQHKQPSRKGKKAWRKNVDITEVQTGLENLREEVTSGGPVSEKPSEELFALDAAGSEDIKKQYKLQKPLKVDQILAERSAIPAVDSRKRSSRTTDGIFEPASKRQKKDWVPKKEIQRIREGLDKPSLTVERLEDDASTALDLWTDSAVPEAEPEAEYVPKPKAKVAPSTIRRAPIAMTASGKGVRPVRAPEGGVSYNPDFLQYDEFLNKIGDQEVEAEKVRMRKAQEESERQARIAAAAAHEEAYQTENESAWEGFTDNEDAEMLKRKRPERKTQAQRNKVKRRKAAEALVRHEQRMADKKKQAAQLLTVLAKKPTEQDEVVLAEDTEESEDDTKLRRRKMGNALILEKPLEVVLPDELQESLRRLKPEGNLLNDRYRNLLVNGKIESRKPVLQPKKKKTKLTEKWWSKDFSIKV